ncbi:TPA: hypothetical protein DEP94_02980, partial [Candidatus Nomurabacteria bacterium]|nr:hypothetical protein [Candidatus Nomurabacteria bacterium]
MGIDFNYLLYFTKLFYDCHSRAGGNPVSVFFENLPRQQGGLEIDNWKLIHQLGYWIITQKQTKVKRQDLNSRPNR